MSETLEQALSGVSETLLLTLYLGAMESQRPDALLKDKKAEALVKKIRDDGLYDFGRMRPLHLSEANKLVIILRNREFDRYTRDFLARHPDAVVVHIGCGLDSRFERVCSEQLDALCPPASLHPDPIWIMAPPPRQKKSKTGQWARPGSHCPEFTHSDRTHIYHSTSGRKTLVGADGAGAARSNRVPAMYSPSMKPSTHRARKNWLVR